MKKKSDSAVKHNFGKKSKGGPHKKHRGPKDKKVKKYQGQGR